MMWYATMQIARKEALQLLRTKRFMAVAIGLLVTMVLISLVAPLILFNIQDILDNIVGADGASFADLSRVPYIHNTLLLFFLTGFLILSGFFLLQLAPVILAADAVSSEWKNRSIFLVLSKPVPRAAFVLGKFVGIVLPLAAIAGAMMLIDYLVIVAVFPGFPGGAEWGRFFGATGMVMMGVMAFGALALFFSTLSNSNVVGMLLSIVFWIIVFPILSALQFFIDLMRGGVNAFTPGATWSNYLSPATMMEASVGVLVPSTGVGAFAQFLGGSFGGSGLAPWWGACIALLVHTLLYLIASIFIVQFRNFE